MSLLIVLRVAEVFFSGITAFSLLAIAVHEIGSDGWRIALSQRKRKVRK